MFNCLLVLVLVGDDEVGVAAKDDCVLSGREAALMEGQGQRSSQPRSKRGPWDVRTLPGIFRRKGKETVEHPQCSRHIRI